MQCGQNWRVVLLLILSGHAGAMADDGPARMLTGAQAKKDVALLREALVEVHAGFGRYTAASASIAQLDDLAARCEDGTSVTELYVDVSRILATLRCDHTKAELPASIVDHRRNTPTFLPFVPRIFAGRVYVAAAAPGVELTRGDEVLSINGRAIGDVIAEIEPLLSVDGWTDHAKVVEFQNGGGELIGNAFDHFWPLLYGWPQRWALEIRQRASDQRRTVTADPVSYDLAMRLAAEAYPGASDFKDGVAFRILDDQTGYLRIDTFVNYRQPVDAAELLRPYFEALRDKQIPHLVLDLRVCGGGSDDAAAALAWYLFPELPPPDAPAWVRTYRFGKLREHLTTWDQRIFQAPDERFRKLDNGYYELLPDDSGENDAAPPANPLVFRGRLSVLMGPADQSGSTIGLALLKAYRKNTRLVGAPSGGSAEGPTAGIILFLDLPNSGIRVRVPWIRSRVGVPFTPGMGVLPDVPVRETVEDWLSDRDVVLEAARKD